MWVAVWRKEVRENRWKWLTFAGVLLAISIAAQAMYNPMRGFLATELGGAQSPLIAALQQQLDNPYLYHWGNWYAKNLYQFTTVFALLLGMSAIAGEVSRGTAAFLFTRPLPRWAVLSAKVAGGFGSLALVIFISTLLLMAVARVGGIVLPWQFLAGLPMTLLGGLVLYLVAVIASILVDDPVRAGAAAAGIMAVLSIPGWVPGWGVYSVYRQMAALPLLLDQPWPLGPALVLAGAAILLYCLAAQLLRRKQFTR